jgi:holo-[acyl-carrier protein] synthase
LIYFTALENSNARSKPNKTQYFAGRFAAKQAVIKALEVSTVKKTTWTEIEIQQLSTGCSSVILYGKCREIAINLNVIRCFLSISHSAFFSVASFIAVREISSRA